MSMNIKNKEADQLAEQPRCYSKAVIFVLTDVIAALPAEL